MTPEQLKASILQYAIQGKLTHQLESDGTAKTLLDDCTADVAVDGKRVKQKNITEISDDEKSFDISENWEWVKLGAVCTIARGGSPRPIKEYITTAEDGINWIKIGDTEKNSKYIYSTAEKIKPSGVLKSRMVYAGDFLLTNSMSFGRPYILKVDGCIHDGWLVISQKKEVFDQDYLYWMLSSRYAYAQFCDKVSGGVVKNLNSDKVANSVFPLPPLAEQKRIVAKIEELLPLVDRYAAAYEKLMQFNAKFPEDMKKSVLQYAIQGKLVEQRAEEGTGEELYRQIQEEKKRLIKEGKIKKEKSLPEIAEDEIPFDIPESWKWVRLLDVVEEKPANGFSPKGVDYQTAVKNLTLTATTSGYFKADAFKYVDIQLEPDSKYWLKKDDLLIQRSNSRELVGTSCIYTGDDDTFIYPDLMMKLRVMNGVDVKYVDHVLKSPLTRNYFSKTASGTSESMPKINQGIVSATLIPLPPLAEQKRIVAKLEEILPLCERLK